MLNNWTEIYTNRFIIISNKTGPVTLTCVLSYQENIKHKSGINLTVSVLNRQRVFKHTAKYRTLQPFVMKDGRTGRSLKKTPLNFSSQQISMTMKTSDKFTKVIINYWGWSFLLKKKTAWWLRKSYSAWGYVAYLELFQNHLKWLIFLLKWWMS